MANGCDKAATRLSDSAAPDQRQCALQQRDELALLIGPGLAEDAMEVEACGAEANALMDRGIFQCQTSGKRGREPGFGGREVEQLAGVICEPTGQCQRRLVQVDDSVPRTQEPGYFGARGRPDAQHDIDAGFIGLAGAEQKIAARAGATPS